MTAIKIFWAFVLANLSFGNTGLEPDWSQILGSISCHNAVREHHYVPNAGCAVTTCEFPQGEYYIFVACNDYEEAACVSLDLKDAKCAEPREVF